MILLEYALLTLPRIFSLSLSGKYLHSFYKTTDTLFTRHTHTLTRDVLSSTTLRCRYPFFFIISERWKHSKVRFFFVRVRARKTTKFPKGASDARPPRFRFKPSRVGVSLRHGRLGNPTDVRDEQVRRERENRARENVGVGDRYLDERRQRGLHL